MVDLGFYEIISSKSSIVSDIMIAMPVWQRIIVGHVVIARVIVPRVLWLTQSNGIFDGWRNILPGLVLATITSSIHYWDLETELVNESP